MPGRTRSKCASGRVSVAAELARWRSGGSTPSRLAASTASPNAATCAAIVGWPGASAYAKWLQMPATSTSSPAAALPAAVDQLGPVAAGGAAAGEPGVDLEVHPGPAAGGAGGGDHLGERPGRGDRDVHVRGDRGGQVLAGHGEPGQQRRGDPGGAQRQRLLQERDAEPARPAGQRGPGGREHAVPVAVGLDHGHHPGRGRRREPADVVPDRVEVDDRLGPHHERIVPERAERLDGVPQAVHPEVRRMSYGCSAS